MINPWARTSGWGGANVAGVRGLEGIFSNVAGLAFTEKTELIFSQTQWLKYGDEAVSNISAFGFSQKVGESGVLGFSVMSMDFGDIEITTVDLPDGGIGTYSPSFMNLSLSYAKIFSNSIYGGMTVKMISEQISNVGANGVALDAGIQYVTGAEDNFKFGILSDANLIAIRFDSETALSTIFPVESYVCSIGPDILHFNWVVINCALVA